ncbi:uncharacterized protein [Parasteatoda tepidariorum]|uniref:uncharacterized protein isoform X2 n=1 Tax=Parasteatoda tepidariorum TaxID=114398 RepID=UPI00077FCA29
MAEYWNREQPLDLRVKNSTKRVNKPYNRDNVKFESTSERNCILASLLKQPSSSKSNVEFVSNSRNGFFLNNASNSFENNSSATFIIPRQPEVIQSNFPTHHSSSGSIHQGIISNIKHEIGFKTNGIKQETDTDEITIVFDSYRDLANGLSKNYNTQSTTEDASSGFVPNYRKFYARCHSNKSFHSRLINQQNLNLQTFSQSDFPFSNFPQRNNELGHINSVQYQSRILNAHFQNQNVPSIKIEQDIEKQDSSENYKHEKDKILKCLLTNTVNDKIYLCNNNYILQNSVYDKKLQYSDVFLRFRYPQLNQKQQQSCHIYYPEAVRTVQKDSILKSLLVTNRLKPDIAQGSSGSYNAGSPGSESTSSSSTDSGVFSDILPDERRRISRGPSNRQMEEN